MTKEELDTIIKNLKEVQDIINTDCDINDCSECKFNTKLGNGYNDCIAIKLDVSIDLLNTERTIKILNGMIDND